MAIWVVSTWAANLIAREDDVLLLRICFQNMDSFHLALSDIFHEIFWAAHLSR